MKKSYLLAFLLAASATCHAQTIELTEAALVKLMTCQLDSSEDKSDHQIWLKISDLLHEEGVRTKAGVTTLRGIGAGPYRIDEFTAMGSFGVMILESVLFDRSFDDTMALLDRHGIRPKSLPDSNTPFAQFTLDGKKPTGVAVGAGKFYIDISHPKAPGPDMSGKYATATSVFCGLKGGDHR